MIENVEEKSAIDFQISKASPEEAKEEVSNFYKFMANNYGQFFSQDPRILDYNVSLRVTNTPWGHGLATKGVDSDSNKTSMSIFYNTDNQIVGYGGATEEGNTLQVAFRVFKDHRTKLDSSRAIDDFLTVSIALASSSVDTVLIPKKQLYNPAIDPEPSGAPLIYRRKGFKSLADSDERRKSDDLAALSSEDLTLELKGTQYAKAAEELRESLNLMI